MGSIPAASRRLIAGYAPPDAGVPGHLQGVCHAELASTPRNLGCRNFLTTKSGKRRRFCFRCASQIANGFCILQNRPRVFLGLAERKPQIEKLVQPGACLAVMHEAVVEMFVPRLRVRHFEPRGSPDRPAAHHVMRELGMKLKAESGLAVPKRLIGETIAFGEQGRARRKIEALAMPFINIVGPTAEFSPGLGRAHRIVADLDLSFGMKLDARAKLPRDNLRAETN